MRLEQLKQAFHAFGRNFRWGTCGECPMVKYESGILYPKPEDCKYTKRYDHQLDLESLMEQFALHKKELDRCDLKNKILQKAQDLATSFIYNNSHEVIYQELKVALDNDVISLEQIAEKFKVSLLTARMKQSE